MHAIFTSFGGVMSFIVGPYGFSNSDISVFGIVYTIGGVVSSIACGIFLDRKPKYKPLTIIMSIVSALVSALFYASLPT